MSYYDEMTVQELRSRRVLCNWIIGLLRGPWSDDPRAEKALERYRDERSKIVSAVRKIKGIDPPAQQVGLKTLNLSARRM